jgi:hypothetical protein
VTRWTIESVLALAPDGKAAAAARKLARPGPWSELGATDALVFGSCQGSGRVPYQVAVDLGEPAFRCTCPSRKFPCKHGLALLMLWADGGGSVADVSAVADHASEWASARDDRAARAGRRAGGEDAGPVDPEAQARRLEARTRRMTDGLADLELWLTDLIRNGLAAARSQPRPFWDQAAARLVDAQMPALAGRVRDLASVSVAGEDWADRLLEELARCWLAVRAWSRRAELPPAVLADLRVVLGWPLRNDEVLASGDRRLGEWQVLGVGRDDLDAVTAQRTWLHDAASGETVHVLDFAAGGGSLPVPPVVGSVVRAELALYPGSGPRRALFVGDREVSSSATRLAMGTLIDDGLAAAAERLAVNPWADRLPLALRDVRLVRQDRRASVVDPDGRGLPIDPHSDVGPVLAVSGGDGCDLFGEWDGRALRPLAAMVGGEVVVT